MNYQASDIIWSIHVDTSVPFDQWQDFTKVGCVDDIDFIPDGEYIVEQDCLVDGGCKTFIQQPR